MKKIISLTLALMLAFACFPFNASAVQESENTVEIIEEQKQETEYSSTLFSPITLKSNNALQNGDKIETFKKNGEIFIEAEAVPQPKSDLVDIVEKNGESFVSLDDLSDENLLQKDEIGSKTVYSKPFQTKRLIAYGKEIPDVGEAKREKLFDGATVLSFLTEEQTKTAYEALCKNAAVSSVETENIYGTQSFTEKDFPLGENLSWGADYVNSPYLVEYENENFSDETVTVAVIDTGINTAHSFLKQRINTLSRSFVDSEPSVEDGNGHGSHVAGIITDNTPDNVEILALKALDADGFGSDIDIAKAINFATEQQVNIISMSFGGYDAYTSSVLKTAIKNAYNAGITLVAAAGNENNDAKYYYPANAAECITVSAIKSDGSPAGYSNFGAKVDVAAPGSNIMSSVNASSDSTDTYESYSGTSMATPFVSAACADAFLLHKVKNPSELKEFIKSKVSHINYQGSRNYGTGVIDMMRYPSFAVCSPVLFNTISGYYTDELTISMTCASDGASIYYTTDGTVPNSNSQLYTQPVVLSENTQIKAVAYCESYNKSITTKASYRFSHYDFDSNYIVDENGYITAYLGSADNLVVQDKINGKKIIGVGDRVFLKSETLKSIVLPDSVIQLGNACFNNCKYLTDIIARGVKYVGDTCFYYDTYANITLGSLERAGMSSFYNCRKVTDETLDISNLEEVESNAFFNCNFVELKSDKMKKIGKQAFRWNDSLLAIDLPNVEFIDAGAFESCDALEYASLDNVLQLGSSAFEITNGELKTVYCPKLEVVGSLCFDGCYKLENINLENVVQLYNDAFGHTRIKSINMPKLAKISSSAFAYMLFLEEVNLPKLTEMPSSMFFYCASLKEIPDCVKDIEAISYGAFRYSGIEEIDFPNAVFVDDEAFSYCSRVKSVHLPLVKEMGTQSNLGSKELREIYLPNVISIDGIEGSENIEKISLPRAITVSGYGFRHDTNLKKLNMPNLKDAQKGYLLYCCTSIENVNLQNLISAGQSSFSDCKSLKEIYLPRCTYVGQSCFEGCDNLEIIDLSSLKSIDKGYYSPFKRCPKLKHLILNNLETFKNAWFYKCDSLKEITLSKLKNITFERGFLDYGDSGPINLDVNMHTPKLEVMMLQHDLFPGEQVYHKSYVFPITMKRVYPSSTSTAQTPALEFFGNTDFDIDERIVHNSHNTPSIFENLPNEIIIEETGQSISIRAYCADPVYTWYYSENGSDFEKYPAPSCNEVLPSKSGYYYCRVKEKETQSAENSEICFVSVKNETTVSVLENSLGESINLLAGGVLYQNIPDGSTLELPTGVDIKLLYNGTFETLYVNNSAVYQEPVCFNFKLSEDSVLTKREEKLIKNCTITNNLKNNHASYTGNRIEPEYIITYKGETLIQGEDYLINFTNNINPNSDAAVMIEGIGEFSGTEFATFHIDIIDLDKCKIIIPSQEYTGEYIKPAPQITYNGVPITSGFTVEYDDNMDIGTAYCFIEGNDRTVTGFRYVTFRIGVSIRNAQFSLDKEEYIYSGKSFGPEVTVRFGSKVLTKGVDYVVSYSNNREVGTGIVTVLGAGRYIHSVELYFTILPNEELQPPAEHTHSFTNACHDDKYHWFSCSCGEESEKEEHKYSELSRYAPSCLDGIQITYNCKVCNQRYIETLPPAGHTPSKAVKEKVVKSTYTKEGSYESVVYCSVCNKEISRKKVITAKLTKKDNPLKANGKTVSLKFSKLNKKNQSISRKSAITVSNSKGKLSFKKSSGNKKITVSSSGKITVKKGLKKGTYKVKIKVKAAGTSSYKSKTVSVTVKIKVK